MEKEQSFNELLKRLKEIVEKLEDPEVSLEDGIKLIEEGTKIHKQCKDKLQKAEIKLTTLFKDKDKE